MAETSADVRRDIELTRDRISNTLEQLENKMNVAQIVKDNPWPALALAVGAGVLLSGSRADVKATAATLVATKGASSKVGMVLDELVAQVVGGFQGMIEQRIDGLANDVKRAIGAPMAGMGNRSGARSGASYGSVSQGSSAGIGAPLGGSMGTGSMSGQVSPSNESSSGIPRAD